MKSGDTLQVNHIFLSGCRIKGVRVHGTYGPHVVLNKPF